VLARFHDTDPTADCGSLGLFVVAATRSDVVAKAKALGLHGINLKINPSPPTDAELRERDCRLNGVSGPTRQRGWRGRLVTDDRDTVERGLDAEGAEEGEDAVLAGDPC
jgi:hypothetical protein